MSRSSTGRQLASTLFQSLSRPSASKTLCGATQPFSSSSSRPAEGDTRKENLLKSITQRPRTTRTTSAPNPSSSSSPGPPKSSSLAELAAQLSPALVASGRAANDTRLVDTSMLDGQLALDSMEDAALKAEKFTEPFHFHVYAHKHNTHVTVTKPNRDAIVSLSCGNLGFRKSQRKHYDSAYQLGAYVIDKLQQQGWHNKITQLEVVLRGFGAGREAVTKVILGNEGRLLRDKIVKLSDSTRLKFGGTRSKKPRRLG
ncbi:Putative 37S ribosomal protein S18, mitochondrial [Cytospora mali]|uniref:Small ribosomal subunit protein uS11m n=1 Tax=Cytospora mali TaxID=578113 RepID=A0A194VV41_CYTMA|nr:Putative 37S ribosomal protein S18, mitochondrial [Valsa mali]